MAFTQFTRDMDIIAKLSDTPNVDDGLTAAQLKEKFDEGGRAIKDYINHVLLVEALERPDFTGLVKSNGRGFLPAEAGKDYQLPLEAGSVTAELLSGDITAQTLGGAVPSTAAEVTLSGWSDNCLSVSVPGVTAESHLVVTPHPDSYVLWCECMVRAAAQGAGTLSFVCEETPGEAVRANVLIVG